MLINLSDMLLHESRLIESRSLLVDLGTQAKLSFSARHYGILHFILSGNVRIRSGNPDESILLGKGDCIVFFYRDQHWLELEGSDTGEARSITDWPAVGKDPEVVSIGTGSAGASVFSSLLKTAYLPQTALSVRAAPDYWLLRQENREDTFHPITLDPKQVRRQCLGPGSAAFANALTGLLLIQVIRNVCAQVWGDRDIQILAPIERQIAAAIREIHANICRDWTVERLAKQVGISRSAFAKAFHDATGQTPMAYLTALRMDRAIYLVANEHLPLREVAERVGYRLESSFARAFKRHHGTAPRFFTPKSDEKSANGKKPAQQDTVAIE